MSKQRFACVVAACLVVALAPACSARGAHKPALADPCMRDGPIKKDEKAKSDFCRPKMNPREALPQGGYLRDGFVYLRIAYDYDVEPWQRKAFQGAMALWNERKDLTGFVFEDATSAIIDYRFQRGAPVYMKRDEKTKQHVVDEARIAEAEKNTCAEYVSTASSIWYSPKTMNWVTDPTVWLNYDTEWLLKHETDHVGQEFKALVRIYAHELGHALRIDHKDKKIAGDSVMIEGELTDCRTKGLHIIKDIQTRDAEDARECACHVRREVRAPR